MPIDITQLGAEIVAALRSEITQGWGKASSFAAKQSRIIAAQAKMIADSRANGTLRDDDALFAFFTRQLRDLTEKFARALAELTIITLEKAWNAIVKIVWGAINGVLGSAGFRGLSLPAPPRRSPA